MIIKSLIGRLRAGLHARLLADHQQIVRNRNRRPIPDPFEGDDMLVPIPDDPSNIYAMLDSPEFESDDD